MEILESIINCIGLIVLAVGVVCVYDARKITKKFFSTSDINNSTKTVKLVGFIVSLIGGIVVFI